MSMSNTGQREQQSDHDASGEGAQKRGVACTQDTSASTTHQGQKPPRTPVCVEQRVVGAGDVAFVEAASPLCGRAAALDGLVKLVPGVQPAPFAQFLDLRRARRTLRVCQAIASFVLAR